MAGTITWNLYLNRYDECLLVPPTLDLSWIHSKPRSSRACTENRFQKALELAKQLFKSGLPQPNTKRS